MPSKCVKREAIVDVKANVNLSSTFSVVPVFTTTTRDVAMPVAGGNSASASSVAKAAGTFGARWVNEATAGRASAMHAWAIEMAIGRGKTKAEWCSGKKYSNASVNIFYNFQEVKISL